MGLFSKNKDAKLIKGVSFGECLIDLFDRQISADKLDRAYAYYKKGSAFSIVSDDDVPESSKTVFMILLQYHDMLPQDMDTVASNVAFAASELLEESDVKDPYKAKGMLEELFAIWPKALIYARRAAEKEEDEENNLLLLCCIHLFGWGTKADPEKAKAYYEKLGELEDSDYACAYDWLRKQFEK